MVNVTTYIICCLRNRSTELQTHKNTVKIGAAKEVSNQGFPYYYKEETSAPAFSVK
jgi:hypothetical protein